jgi:hypothetical protein
LELKDLTALAKSLAPVVRGYVAESIESLKADLRLDERLAEVRAEIPAPVEIPPIDYDEITKKLDLSFPAEEIQPLIDAAVAKSVAEIDIPAVEVPDFGQMISDAVTKAVAEIPRPKDGESGKDGESVSLDDMKSALESHFAKWALDFERQAHDVVQKTIDRMPKPKDGVDGFGFEDMDVTHDGIGNVKLTFASGAKVKEFDIRLPVIIDQGVYREGNEYLKGSGVTLGGSFFIAQVDNPKSKPGVSDDWRLAVKKGRDAPRGDK